MTGSTATDWIGIGLGIVAFLGSFTGAIWYIRGQFADLKTEIAGMRSDLIYLSKEIGKLEAENDRENQVIWSHINSHREFIQTHGQEIAVLKSKH